MHHAECQLLAGDRVRLKQKIAESLMKEHAKGGRKANWRARRGIIICVSELADRVTVKWDDRNTTDFWPTRALKKAP